LRHPIGTFVTEALLELFIGNSCRNAGREKGIAETADLSLRCGDN
jgi:hypothetical protein